MVSATAMAEAGSPHGLGGGVFIGSPSLHRAAVPADDEQPVVDPDTEADQDGQLGRHTGDAERVAEQAELLMMLVATVVPCSGPKASWASAPTGRPRLAPNPTWAVRLAQ